MKSLSINVCCNHSIFSLHINFVINKNRRAPAVKYDHVQPVVGGYDLYPLNDYISN